MKILAVHKGFACDHSSTSYEFLAVDRPLDVKAKAEVSSLSSRACPTDRRVSFIYHAEGYDIPGGWEALMRDHYDVMYSESYDWWTFAMAFDAPKAEQEALGQYEFAGVDELGVSIGCDDSRVTVTVSCRIDSSVLYALTEDEYEGHGHDYDEDYDDEDEDFAESGNGLLDLLSQVREQLIAGDYRAELPGPRRQRKGLGLRKGPIAFVSIEKKPIAPSVEEIFVAIAIEVRDSKPSTVQISRRGRVGQPCCVVGDEGSVDIAIDQQAMLRGIDDQVEKLIVVEVHHRNVVEAIGIESLCFVAGGTQGPVARSIRAIAPIHIDPPGQDVEDVDIAVIGEVCRADRAAPVIVGQRRGHLGRHIGKIRGAGAVVDVDLGSCGTRGDEQIRAMILVEVGPGRARPRVANVQAIGGGLVARESCLGQRSARECEDADRCSAT